MDYLIKILDIIIWPALVLIVVLVLKKPIVTAFLFLNKVKYRDLEIDFKRGLKEIKQVVEETDVGEKLEDLEIPDVSASVMIINAWAEIEDIAREKVIELIPPGEKRDRALIRPVDFLSCSKALIPIVAESVRKMGRLRDNISHFPDDTIEKSVAIEYLQVSKKIISQINALIRIPIIKHTSLTHLILELNHLIDSGRYDDITIDEVYSQIENRNILPYLNERTNELSDFSLLINDDGTCTEFVNVYHEYMERLYNACSGDHRRKWGVENKGLCLVLAWTNEILQQGSGWHPSDI